MDGRAGLRRLASGAWVATVAPWLLAASLAGAILDVPLHARIPAGGGPVVPFDPRVPAPGLAPGSAIPRPPPKPEPKLIEFEPWEQVPA